MKEPKRRTTEPGLGAVNADDSGSSAAKTSGVRDMTPEEIDALGLGPPPVSGFTRAATVPAPPLSGPSVESAKPGLLASSSAPPPGSGAAGAAPSASASASAPPTSGDRAATGKRPKTSRPPVRVDEVGDVAVAIARRASRPPTPRVLKSRSQLSALPIDHRDAFVLSLIDGKMSLQALVDVAAMPRDEVLEILQRLEQLGVVSLG